MFAGNVAAVKLLPDDAVVHRFRRFRCREQAALERHVAGERCTRGAVARELVVRDPVPGELEERRPGVPFGNSKPSTPLLALFVIVLFSTRSA